MDHLPPPPPPPSPRPAAPADGLPPVRPGPGAAIAWKVGASIVAVATLAFTVSHVIGVLAHEERTEAFSIDDPDVALLDVDSEGGRVEVIGDDVDAISVRARVSDGINPTGFSHRVEGDRLVIEVVCTNVVANPWCHVDLEIVVPRDLEVVVDAEGHVSLRDLAGPVDASTDTGGIDAQDLAGTTRLAAGDGTVQGLALATERLEATSGNGSIDLELAIAPRTVTATSDNGRVEVALPRTEDLYAVDAGSRNGSVDNQIRTDPASPRRVLAQSDNGSITLRYLG